MEEIRHKYRPDAESVRARMSPRARDSFYLHHKDLRLALENTLANPTGVWLDFGCGGSPYRPLFGGASRYIRADIAGENLDVILRPPAPLDLPDGSVNGVVSTQVLEHVSDLDWYLRECRRVLAPGGRLILSTHGTWVDHFWPSDFRRWTTIGLRTEIERHGFAVRETRQLTCGMRAVITLWELKGRVSLRGRMPVVRFLLLAPWACFKLSRPFVNPLLDRALASDAIQNQQGDTEGALYVDLLLEAIRT